MSKKLGCREKSNNQKENSPNRNNPFDKYRSSNWSQSNKRNHDNDNWKKGKQEIRKPNKVKGSSENNLLSDGDRESTKSKIKIIITRVYPY